MHRRRPIASSYCIFLLHFLTGHRHLPIASSGNKCLGQPQICYTFCMQSLATARNKSNAVMRGARRVDVEKSHQVKATIFEQCQHRSEKLQLCTVHMSLAKAEKLSACMSCILCSIHEQRARSGARTTLAHEIGSKYLLAELAEIGGSPSKQSVTSSLPVIHQRQVSAIHFRNIMDRPPEIIAERNPHLHWWFVAWRSRLVPTCVIRNLGYEKHRP